LKPRRYGFDDTEAPYREWRYEWGVGAVHDVDQIEWRGNKPLCVIELTRVKHDMTRTEHAVCAVSHAIWACRLWWLSTTIHWRNYLYAY
jgi:hypothetical protein